VDEPRAVRYALKGRVFPVIKRIRHAHLLPWQVDRAAQRSTMTWPRNVRSPVVSQGSGARSW
jgi:hypothetical protein